MLCTLAGGSIVEATRTAESRGSSRYHFPRLGQPLVRGLDPVCGNRPIRGHRSTRAHHTIQFHDSSVILQICRRNWSLCLCNKQSTFQRRNTKMVYYWRVSIMETAIHIVVIRCTQQPGSKVLKWNKNFQVSFVCRVFLKIIFEYDFFQSVCLDFVTHYNVRSGVVSKTIVSFVTNIFVLPKRAID